MPAIYQNANTQTISATASNLNTALSTGSLASRYLSVLNVGPNVVFVKLGAGSQTASTTTSLPVAVNERVVICRGNADDNIGVICAATQTATVYVTAVDYMA